MVRTALACFLLVCAASLMWTGLLEAEEVDQPMQSSFNLQTSVMGSAGSRGSSTGFRAKSSMAQSTPTGTGSSAEKTLYAGFWAKPWVITGVLETERDIFTNSLFQNCPNPFTGFTIIAYTVARESQVELTVFDIRGRKVKTLVSRAASAGLHKAAWDMRNGQGDRVSPGVYFYRFKVGSYSSVRKMVLVK